MDNNCGIYRIQNVVTGKFYIGSSIKLHQRKKEHFHYLNKNTHVNKRLQNSYNKHGEANFEFSIVEFCHVDILLEREQYYIDTEKPGYNICRVAGNTFGVKMSSANRKKMSERNTGVLHPLYDPKIYHFWHQVKGEVDCTKQEMIKIHKVSKGALYALVNGVYISVKGWYLDHWKPMPPAPNRRMDIDDADLVKEYKSGKSMYEIGDKYGIGGNRVMNRLKKAGVKMRTQSETLKLKVRGKLNIKEIIRKYRSGSSMAELTREYKVSQSTIQGILDDNGIKCRTFLEAMANFSKNKNPNIELGKLVQGVFSFQSSYELILNLKELK